MRARIPALLLALAFAGPAQAAVLGGPMLREGLEVFPGTLTGMEVDRPLPGMTKGADAIVLTADVHAGANGSHGFPEHAFVPYLSVSYTLSKDGEPTARKSGLLYPVATRHGPLYAGGLQMAGPGTYRLTYIVSPPSAHGMLRQTDAAGGVPDWWKPFSASWTFTWPLNSR